MFSNISFQFAGHTLAHVAEQLEVASVEDAIEPAQHRLAEVFVENGGGEPSDANTTPWRVATGSDESP